MCIKYFKLSCLFLLFMTGFFELTAQNIEIKGRVVDAETNKPVEFANIGVVGTYMGTASDFDGYYELVVGESFVNYKVQISAVGYKVKEFTVDELHILSGENIKLFSQTYGIQQVDVKADSKRLYGILKTASNIIEDSYEDAYAANVYWRQKLNQQTTEAVVNYSDNKGYGDRILASAYEARNYGVNEVRRDFEVSPIKKGMLFINDVLAFDIVRQRGNVLDIDFVDEYALELAEETVVDGDSVWVINYQLDDPDLAKTGDAYCEDYKGTIIIRQKDYSVVRNELNFVTKGFFHAGRDAFRENNTASVYSGKVIVDYRMTGSKKYAASKISYSGKSDELNLDAEWIVYDYQSYKDANAKTFYTEKKENKDFWSRFTLPE
ncbi:carboxypeptidase-like regulatory domain-containing protein [Carboxylicivirga mesophila]|uniref:Carboxypeptidase-like regulatory domain-containing protein n=1 Tax=Carboxylicivirga mesophila TaxID=1166478 RepID=A0ABS5KFZ6_9BACT|nr:carboxypeptidase-like regulatory domain-containing protein [Carboxylicivirga mesophila]MBS2213920.1 carboxypeptidase-like regulatory domain-containing protein [Carboxylicivirga mesophila]